MDSVTYQSRRGRLEAYFDRTAASAWAKLTSDGPVSRIRTTVREGRDQMRRTLLGWLPDDLTGCRILDAGCGTGLLAVDAARRGAEVVAVDLSPTLVGLARERLPADLLPASAGQGRIDFRVGDMLDPELGRFDYVVAMDSLIHYQASDLVEMVARLAERADRKFVFTFAPRTTLLTIMHAMGVLFPRTDKPPAIEPITERTVRRRADQVGQSRGFGCSRTHRVSKGFYISQALEVVRS